MYNVYCGTSTRFSIIYVNKDLPFSSKAILIFMTLTPPPKVDNFKQERFFENKIYTGLSLSIKKEIFLQKYIIWYVYSVSNNFVK
jgi:hypothetical protein